jgi:N6-adenosine-specific RNA methylase IME4
MIESTTTAISPTPRPGTLIIDPEFKALIPPLSPDERAGLEKSILEEGCRDALVVWKGHNILVDGHTRYEICTAHGKPFETVEMEFASRDDAMVWIIDNQISRRNLTPFARGELALKRKHIIATKAKKNQQLSKGRGVKGLQNSANLLHPIDTRAELAKIAGVSHDTIARIEKIVQKAPEEVKEKLRRGDLTINKVYNEIKREENRQRYAERVKAVVSPPTGKYRVILADPPWRYEFSETRNREIENHYPTMDLEAIKALKIPAEDEAILFLWTTAPKLEESLAVLNAWGFKYRTCAVWDKERKGMGYWFRIQHELLLVGVRGNFRTPDPTNRFDSVIRAPRTEHSKKPAIVHEMIEKMFPGERYVELFAREERPGWAVWGNEV